MAKVPILVVLLLQLLCTLLEVSGQQSPCLEYFTYIFDPATNQVMGQIQILSPPKNVELYLKVTLSIAVELPTNYVGILKVAQSKNKLVDQTDKPLLYHIYFPLPQPIPQLTGIWFNNQQYCSGPHTTGQVVTSITLDHTLYLSSVLPNSQNSYDSSQQNLNTNFQSNISLSTPQPTVPVYTSTSHTPLTQRPITSSEINKNPLLKPQSPVQPDQQSSECGISSPPIIYNSLSSNDMKTSRSQWPWLVAIFHFRTKYELLCVGSILSKKHVITAASCLKTTESFSPDALMASFGKYLLNQNETGTEYREIAYFTFHPDFNSSSTSGDADLAILTMKTPVEFSPTIRPICMWYTSVDLQKIVDKTGYIVWWKEPFTEEPRMLKAPIVSQETCLSSHLQFSSLTSNRTFCAGMRDGNGPCFGSGGSGLMLYDPDTQRYQMRGILSRTVREPTNFCHGRHYFVFVDVAKYVSWIYPQISTE
ncbi:Serine protease gd [Camponotus floridanus]|uniref:Serine protease gd n=1 Tax=Camponotus floridanus TaxID=104421 RepID=E2AEC5_CAMFO|nr:Serine protease gd [Camponotus floridanus]